MSNASVDSKKGNRILAAVSKPESLDSVGLYAIMLAKRTGTVAFLLLVLNEKESGGQEERKKEGIDEKIKLIQEAGADVEVRVDALVTTGVFTEEVAKYLMTFDSPILVVGEGDNRKRRGEEVREIEKNLMHNGNWHHNHSHHFLIVSKKHKIMPRRNKVSATT